MLVATGTFRSLIQADSERQQTSAAVTGYAFINWPEAVWSAHSTLPGATAHMQCQQWGKSYFGCVAGADLGYDLCIALEGPVNLRAMTTEISNKILVDNISQE